MNRSGAWGQGFRMVAILALLLLTATPARPARTNFGGVQTPNGVVEPHADLAFGAFQRGYYVIRFHIWVSCEVVADELRLV